MSTGNDDDNKPGLKVVVDNSANGADADDGSAPYAAATLHGHKFSGKSLLDAVDVLDRGSRENFPANDLKDVGMKLSVLGMAEAHIKRLSRLDRAMNLIEQQLATPDRLAQMPANELAKLYRLLGASMDVSQRYVKESMWAVNIGELQEQIADLMAGAGAGAGDDSDHSTREVVADIFRRVSTLGQTFPEPNDGSVPEVNPDYLPNDLLKGEDREKAEEARQASHQAMVDEAKAEVQKSSEGPPEGASVAGMSSDELRLAMAEEVGESAPIDLSSVGDDAGDDWDGDPEDGDEWDVPDDRDDWGDDDLGGKDDPLAGVKLDF